MRLTGMTGSALCAELRKRVGSELIIIALTAQALPEERNAILNSGFNDILLKPFREHELTGLLQQNVQEKVIDVQSNFSMDELEKMTYGDKDLMRSILEQFIEDSRNDFNLLKHAVEHADVDKAVLLFHRLAGRTSQVGDKKLGAEFRKCELELDQPRNTDHINRKIARLQVKMEDLIVKINAWFATQQVTSEDFVTNK